MQCDERQGIVTPIDHYERLRADPSCRGPNGGLRVSYNALNGRYLRQGAFVDLIRSGYIGAHAQDTKMLKTLIDAVRLGGRPMVLAIQSADKPDHTLEDEEF